MKILIAVMMLALGAATASAQSLDDLNIQIHGYATQGFLYTTQNNFLTTESSNGSPGWTEAVINVGAQPISKLRIAVQARYQLLGNYANGITLDWASADYKAAEFFGVRFGKVKVPSGLFNDIQDIDPAYNWALLPQGVYPLSSRNGQLATYGAVLYGTVDLPSKLGKLEYRAWAGEKTLPSNDGYWITFNEEGITLPNGLAGVGIGEALHWKTPLPGLMVGASLSESRTSRAPLLLSGAVPGSFTTSPFFEPDFFVRYDHKKLMVAAETNRQAASYVLTFGGPITPARFDLRANYVMASYRLTEKLTAGVYNSQFFDVAVPPGQARFSKDWAFSGRYDITQYIYAKAEEHFINGTAIGYDTTLNPNGLKPTTRLTVLKIGVSF